MLATDPKETRKEWLLKTEAALFLAAGISFFCSLSWFYYRLLSGADPDRAVLLFLVAIVFFGLSRGFRFLAKGIVTDKEAEALRKRKQQEKEEEEEKVALWNKYYRAFQNGIMSDYPRIDAGSFPIPLKPEEVCYAFTTHAILGRGMAHQLEISRESNAGLGIKAIKLGRSKNVKDSYSTIRYDEKHPGGLVVTNLRIVFLSAPTVFLDFAPGQVLSVAWVEQYVMLRTNISSDESKNLLAFRIEEREFPSWVFAAAIFRAKADSVSAPTLPTGIG